MAEEVYARDLKSLGETHASSSLVLGIQFMKVEIECRGSYKKIFEFLKTVAKTGMLVMSKWESDVTIITIECDKNQYEYVTSILDELKSSEFRFVLR